MPGITSLKKNTSLLPKYFSSSAWYVCCLKRRQIFSVSETWEGSVEFEAETWIICPRGSHSQTTQNFGAFIMLFCKRRPSGYLKSISTRALSDFSNSGNLIFRHLLIIVAVVAFLKSLILCLCVVLSTIFWGDGRSLALANREWVTKLIISHRGENS